MEDDLSFGENGRWPQLFFLIEDDFNFLTMEDVLIFLKVEYDLIFFQIEDENQPNLGVT